MEAGILEAIKTATELSKKQKLMIIVMSSDYCNRFMDYLLTEKNIIISNEITLSRYLGVPVYVNPYMELDYIVLEDCMQGRLV